MPSPFPGMNPYLEDADDWEDFHLRFIAHAADALSPQTNEHYRIKAETRLILHELSADERTPFAATETGIAIALPAVETVKERFLQIIDRRSRKVVTVIEVLSPTNKRPGPDRDAYLAKRNTLTRTGVNLVELDLRRGGRRPAPPEIPPCDYAFLVARAADRTIAEVWTVGLREPLPRLPIPLSEPDADLVLDVKAVLEHTYDQACYANDAYQYPLDPPLAAADAVWAAELLRAAGLPTPA